MSQTKLSLAGNNLITYILARQSLVSDILTGAGKSQTLFNCGTPSLSYRETNVFVAVGIVTIAPDRLHWISDVSTSCRTPAWKDTNEKFSVKGHL
jgi:hypothetical protein